MNALYCRVSTLDQKTDRQKINEDQYSIVIEDKCSGAIAFFKRQGGEQIKKLIEQQAVNSVAVWSIDRLGRDLRDILDTIHYCNERNVTVHFISQGLKILIQKCEKAIACRRNVHFLAFGFFNNSKKYPIEICVI